VEIGPKKRKFAAVFRCST